MKRFLLSLVLMGTLISAKKISAQCTLSAFSTTITSSIPSGSNVALTFNVSFNLEANNGNKLIYIHLWEASKYSAVTYSFTNGDAPLIKDLNGVNNSHSTLYNLGINNQASNAGFKTFFSTYTDKNNNSINLNNPGNANLKIFKKALVDSFVITGITVTLPASAFNYSEPIQGAIWSANAASGSRTQCAFSEVTFISDPSASGVANCSSQQYQLNISHTSTSSAPFSGTYDMYVDKNGSGLLELTGNNPDVLLSANTAFTVNVTQQGTSSIYSGTSSYSGSVGNWKGYNLFAVLHSSSPSVTVFIPSTECGALPVHFKSFIAERKSNSVVELKWATASEQNNKGFNVQRNVGGEWKNIAFVFSAADGGNSSSDLSYGFKDQNSEKGITQYRIQQVDIDNKASYSDIRAIRGDGAASKVSVYPNPSTNGKVSVVFENGSSVRDVIVSDMQGRIVNQYRGITSNILVVEELKSGFYTLKITDRNTAVSSVEKVVVK